MPRTPPRSRRGRRRMPWPRRTRPSSSGDKPSVDTRDDVGDTETATATEDDDDNDDDRDADDRHQSSSPGPPESPGAPSSGGKGFMICTVISIQYVKLVVLLGLALPVSEVLVSDIFPQSFEQTFYLYLYLVSLLFMLYVYIASAWRHRRKVTVKRYRGQRGIRYRLKVLRQTRAVETVRYGSVYLRLAMNAFGIGSMIYCCLEVAHGLVKYQNYHCEQAEQQVKILLPACRAILTLAQMHFMLFNNKASEISRHRCISRIGLAHMIATNICEWLSVVVEETRHEIAELGTGGHALADRDELDSLTGNFSSFDFNSTRSTPHPCEPASDSPEKDVIGNLLQSSGPFLFPCTIEYSLICAVILFEIWKHAGKAEDEGSASRMGSRLDLSNGSRSSRVVDQDQALDPDTDDDMDSAEKKRPQAQSTVSGGGTGTGSVPWRTALHLSLDLTHSQRGMFLGIVLQVATIMSLVLFFALGEADGYQRAAHTLVCYVEGSLHVFVILGVVFATISMRRLGVDRVPYHPLPMDMFLLFVAQTGAYLYSIFSIVGASLMVLQDEEPTRARGALRVLVVEVLSVVHAGVQTHFLLRAWHMRCVGERQWSSKPGREYITFLIHGSLCSWLVATFCKSRAQFRPLHLTLFGVWPWTVITHVSIPLTIFLHFHSSICLFEVWKNVYKFRPD
ncbi:proton channel OtopLc-like isoform X2 [Thrips palmi]|uniref:Proton channel OtopLc-like isoform X2 n=1 Tax=Thrips palmi TaxID=161013 RepID=A0A6P9ADV2_THRPL|nr:proton channel OtopLc-like isoform X2 [Thrips palmi]